MGVEVGHVLIYHRQVDVDLSLWWLALTELCKVHMIDDMAFAEKFTGFRLVGDTVVLQIALLRLDISFQRI